MCFFNETWLASNECVNLEIQEYKSIHIFGNKSPRAKKGRHSGGISLYFRDYLTDKIKIMEQKQCGILWVKILRDIFEFNEDVYMCHIYNPPQGSKVINHEDINFFEVLEQGIVTYKTLGKIFITGDFNSMSAEESDILDFDTYLAEEELDVDIDRDYEMTDRKNKDKVLDKNGRKLLLLCQSGNLIIANGRLHSDRNIGEFTYCGHNGLRTVDYLLLNPNDASSLSDFNILLFNEFSDHAPIHISFPLKLSTNNPEKPTCENPDTCADRFNQSRASIFRNKLGNSHEYLERFNQSRASIFRNKLGNSHEYLEQLTEQVNNGHVDDIVQNLTSKDVFGQKSHKQMTAHQNIISLEMNGTIKIVLKQKKILRKQEIAF